MENLNEDLIRAWFQLSTCLDTKRIYSDLPFNESYICNILYHQRIQTPEKKLTATDLCQKTRIQKSLMNRTLNNLEEKGLIQRERSRMDKRQFYISLTDNEIDIYKHQHEKVLQLVDTIIQQLGEDNTQQMINQFLQIINMVDEVLHD